MYWAERVLESNRCSDLLQSVSLPLETGYISIT